MNNSTYIKDLLNDILVLEIHYKDLQGYYDECDGMPSEAQVGSFCVEATYLIQRINVLYKSDPVFAFFVVQNLTALYGKVPGVMADISTRYVEALRSAEFRRPFYKKLRELSSKVYNGEHPPLAIVIEVAYTVASLLVAKKYSLKPNDLFNGDLDYMPLSVMLTPIMRPNLEELACITTDAGPYM